MRDPTERPTEVSVSERLLAEMRREFPGFRLVAKRDDGLSRWLSRALYLLTLGGQRSYLTEYHTVLGDTLYLPTSWDRAADVDRAIVLRHERVHLRQRRRYGLVGMAFIYLIPWFPVGLAWGRARLEWEAYEETLRGTAELKGMEAARDPLLRARIVGRFTGPAYGWMWPFPKAVQHWYDQLLDELEGDATSHQRGHEEIIT